MSDYSLTENNYKATLVLNIDRKVVDEKMGKVLKELSNQIVVPGFRKGKVPAQIVKSRIGIETVVEECVEEIVPSLLEEAIDNEKLEVASKPRLDKVENHKGDVVKATVTFDLFPYIQTGDLNSIELEIESPIVSDDEIQHEMRHFLKVDAELEDAPDDKIIDESDVATVDLIILNPTDEESEPLLERKDMIIDIDDNKDYEQIAIALKGHKLNDEVTGELSLGSVKANFKAEIKKVRTLKLPELNDDWVKANSEYETADAYVESVRLKLQDNKYNQALSSLTAALFDHYKDELVNGVHATMVMDMASTEYSRLTEKLKASNLTLDKYLKILNMSYTELEDSITNSAFETLAMSVMLRSVARTLNIDPSEEEIESFIFDSDKQNFDNNFENFKKQMDELVNTSEKSKQILMSRAKNLLMTQKAFDYLKENLKLKDAQGNVIENSLLIKIEPENELGAGADNANQHDDDKSKESDAESELADKGDGSADGDIKLSEEEKGETVD